ncbi:MAG: serine/threonine protein phosphatase [Acutalibacteraceae bacterium]
MRLFKKKAADKNICAVQTAESRYRRHPFGVLSDYSADCVQYRLFETLRESVPLIDGALDKIVRLTGDFEVKCKSRVAQSALRQFLKNVKVGANGRGIACFINSYLNQLLTYGTAVGEIVPYSDKSGIAALYNASLDSVELKCGDSPLDLLICSRSGVGEAVPVKNPSLILHTALNPDPGKAYGRSILRGLPFVSDILLKIFNSIGENWERVGNIRFAVSCSSDGANAKERAQQIARQWSLAMSDKEQTRDFVSVGDVSIKVIGADNQILDSEVPVRQLLEQIVAKLSVPPFLLGLSWSSTERMASQQCDILTSELEWYRALITPVIDKICQTFLRMSGFEDSVEIEWSNINLQDETELAQARLWRAQALEIEQRIKEGEVE